MNLKIKKKITILRRRRQQNVYLKLNESYMNSTIAPDNIYLRKEKKNLFGYFEFTIIKDDAFLQLSNLRFALFK